MIWLYFAMAYGYPLSMVVYVVLVERKKRKSIYANSGMKL